MDILCLVIGAYILTSAFKDEKENFSAGSSEGDYVLKKSRIHGTGLFSTKYHKKGDVLIQAITIEKEITERAKYVNHCNDPSTILEQYSDGWLLRAKRDILAGDEITADYNNTPYFIKKPDPSWTC
jgi:SET domain-containing protein